MPRGPRNAPGDLVYHVLNRGVARRRLFHKVPDYAAFERCIHDTLSEVPTRCSPEKRDGPANGFLACGAGRESANSRSAAI